ncbi:helix-turn-helix domain-containing protein [Tepidibacter mesophilus]|uniref:helix-turn-helix domain-containing protein n=1 Tax=Tepidibacter mesophilus TaxID=655607 RepID=UPI000C078FE9|nr:helix-turn-helix domain-containing protein [Tepidibacter mesophilus]
MNDINVGKKISEYRNLKNMTVTQLAKMAGVTPSLLSQIEKGTANPSINTLKIISKSLDIPMFTFFITRVDTNQLIVRSDKRKKMIFPQNNNLSYELLSPNLNGAIELALITLTTNSQSSNETMAHEGEEVAYVINGKVNIHLNDEIITLNEGDSIKILPHMKHKWENPYDKDANVIFAITPPSF